jgi:hypothetical protein
MIANHPFREIFSLKFTGRARRSIDGGVRSRASILSDDKVLILTSMFLNTIVALKQTHKQVPKNPFMCPKFTIDPIAFFTNDKH